MFGTLVDAAYHLYLPLKVCMLHDFGWFWGTLIDAVCHLYLALKGSMLHRFLMICWGPY